MRVALLTWLYLTCFLVNGDAEIPIKETLKLKQSSCSADDDCDISLATDDNGTNERSKYVTEQGRQHQVLDQDDKNIYLSNEQLREKIDNIRDKKYKQNQPLGDNNLEERKDGINFEQSAVGEAQKEDTSEQSPGPSLYEFPPLTRVDPVKVSQY